MKKRIKSLLLLFCISATLLASCKKTAQETKSPTAITITTADSTGSIYQLGNDVSTIWNDALPYIKASAVASNGGVDNLKSIKENKNTIGFAVTSIAYEAYTGTGVFLDDSNENLRVIAGLYYNPNQVIVKADSDIMSLSDLVGKRFSPGVVGGTTLSEALLHYQTIAIDIETSMDLVHASYTDSIKLMTENQLDGFWFMAGIPNEAIAALTENNIGRLISIDDSVIVALQSQYPWYANYVIPEGTYANQEEDIKTTAVKLVMVTSSEVPDEIIYDLTKTFWEHIEDLKLTNPVLNSITMEGTITDLSDLPLHNGAKKYYREVGIID